MRKLILPLILIIIVALSGCINQDGTTTNYKNDIITVEDYSISTMNPYVGSMTTIEFSIKNNGDETVKEVEVNFFDRPGFSVDELFCEGIEEFKLGSGNSCESDSGCPANEFCDLSVKKCYNGCLFTNIESLDFRTIGLTLKAKSSGTYTVSYSVDYGYSGFRKADIPIIDGVTRKSPIATFSQSTSTYGPVTLEFEPPVGRETKEGSKVTKEYWIVGDRPFEVKMNFEHVGSSSVGSIQPVVISIGNVKLDLRGSLAIGQSGTTKLPCDFSEYGNLLFSDKDLEVPGELTCNFQSASTVELETMATIWAEFNYTYKYIKIETFSIQSLEENGEETTTTSSTIQQCPGGCPPGYSCINGDCVMV